MDNKQQPYNNINSQTSNTANNNTNIAQPSPIFSPNTQPTANPQTQPAISPQAQPVISPSTQPKSKKNQLKIIAISVLAVAIFALAGFVIYKTVFDKSPSPKTIAQFEQAMEKIGYEKAKGEGTEYNEPRGGYVTYFKQDETSADGVTMFYNVESKEYLKDLVNEFGVKENPDMATLFENFDWSKDYNKKEVCSKNNAQAYVCLDAVQVKNTILFILYHSNSEDKVHSEVNKVLSAMDYNKE